MVIRRHHLAVGIGHGGAVVLGVVGLHGGVAGMSREIVPRRGAAGYPRGRADRAAAGAGPVAGGKRVWRAQPALLAD